MRGWVGQVSGDDGEEGRVKRRVGGEKGREGE